MKKLIAISILLACVSSAAFAQLKIGFEAQGHGDLIYYTNYFGKIVTVSETKKVGDKQTGSFNFLNSQNAWSPGNTLNLTFTHTGEYHEASLQLSAGDIIDGLISGDGKWKDILDMGTFGDWYLKVTPGVFDGYIGNTGYGGKVDTYDNFNDFLGLGLGAFGVYKPSSSSGITWQKSDNINLWSDSGDVDNASAFAVGATFGSFKLALGSSLPYTEQSWNKPGASANSINGAFIISGDNVADLLNLDLFYSIRGGDPENHDRNSGGKWDNVFGIYAGLNLMDGGLGVSIGYTGNALANEKIHMPGASSEEDAKPRSIINPLYSGVSIHLNFSGIDKINVTFNNNLSFSAVKGKEEKDDDAKRYKGLMGSNPGKDCSEGWFAWHAALIGTYSLSDSVALSLQLANQLGSYTFTNKTQDTTVKKTTTADEFRAVLMADYSVGAATIGAGLSFGVAGITDKTKANNTESENHNVLTFAVPLYVKVAF